MDASNAVRNSNPARRVFTVAAPKQLCFTDLTFAPTQERFACVCFVIADYSGDTVGHRVSTRMETKLSLSQLKCRSDPGAGVS
jgi:transposase InsO family protein